MGLDVLSTEYSVLSTVGARIRVSNGHHCITQDPYGLSSKSKLLLSLLTSAANPDVSCTQYFFGMFFTFFGTMSGGESAPLFCSTSGGATLTRKLPAGSSVA